MRTPVFTFMEERLTDAPLAVFQARLAAPGDLASLKACGGLHPLEVEGEELVLRWHQLRLGTMVDGTLRVLPLEQGVHLRLDGRLKGWSAFLLLGWVRWSMDRLLDQLVREL